MNSSGANLRDEIYAGGRHLANEIYGMNLFVMVNNPVGIVPRLAWLGTERGRLNASGSLLQTCQSWPFGDALACSGGAYNAQSPLFFTGKQRDHETGLDYFGARYNSSSYGRFMTPDWSKNPTGVPYADYGNPQSLNLYAYVLNNPVTRVDADGHSYLVFDGEDHTLTLYSKGGAKLGIFPAYNNVDSHKSIGKLVNGAYAMQDTSKPHLHSGASARENGSVGPGGIFRFKAFKGADGKIHSGVGVHAGRATKPDGAGRSGPAHATYGCIRTNDAGIAKITATAKSDPLTSTTVVKNRPSSPKPLRHVHTDIAGEGMQ